MVRVCEDTIQAKGRNDAGFYMDDVLKMNLDFYVKNAVKDWDFCIVISGQGQVRVGKSVLAMQIAYYWTDQMKKVHGIDVPFSIQDNIVFKGTDLISKGNALGKKYPHSALVFDEAGADLQGTKFMRITTQNVKDFMRECGQYNLLTILVIPEYFDLPKGIALSRADCLIDVFVLPNPKTMIWDRGFFNFYSRPNKKMLYLKGKKELDYQAHKKDFHGRFYNNYVVDEVEYRQAKQIALVERETEDNENKYLKQRNAFIKILEDDGYNAQQISDKAKEKGIMISRRGISHVLDKGRGQNSIKLVYEDEDDVDEDEVED